jgi:uncharacterized membrane protein YeaQ/YmgE (transglycosylase-associated protein family)
MEGIMGIVWSIIIGFVAGVIAKFIMPGDKEPKGFILTTILGPSGLLWQAMSGRRWAGMPLVRGLASSGPLWGLS